MRLLCSWQPAPGPQQPRNDTKLLGVAPSTAPHHSTINMHDMHPCNTFELRDGFTQSWGGGGDARQGRLQPKKERHLCVRRSRHAQGMRADHRSWGSAMPTDAGRAKQNITVKTATSLPPACCRVVQNARMAATGAWRGAPAPPPTMTQHKAGLFTH